MRTESMTGTGARIALHTSGLGTAEVTWVVGMDGSRLAFRCLRLAAMLMDLNGLHEICVLRLVRDRGISHADEVGVQTQCQEDLRRCGVPLKRCSFKKITIRTP
jgi:hypothetical protein